MSKPHLPAWVGKLLDLSAEHRYYPLVLALIAFCSTATFAFPFVIILIPGIMLAPRRWLIIGIFCGIASGCGGAVLVEIFHFMGHELVIARFPHLAESEYWRLANEWLQNYGLLALAVIAGSPLPQTPIIFLYSLTAPSTLGVLLAVGVGKTMKYVFLSWLIARYPARFIHYRLDL